MAAYRDGGTSPLFRPPHARLFSLYWLGFHMGTDIAVANGSAALKGNRAEGQRLIAEAAFEDGSYSDADYYPRRSPSTRFSMRIRQNSNSALRAVKTIATVVSCRISGTNAISATTTT